MDIEGLDLNKDDVVVVKDFCNMQKYQNFTKQVKQSVGNSLVPWLEQGAEIEFLKASGGGWKKGKLYLRLEFVSDEPPQSDNPESLDALRRELNTD
ncbi:hypothetical protein H6F74_09575 [Trichocoleus sp. FACHB-90]|uniref:KGK domain-containing protein n=1 Tax=Cyanophyceae TaxID=3028117 RepID=UPI0016826892|nr:KGK domain-containing protein [Trichocoleus sp. FACHB-90]MBD1926491.1 hypothetical protein [Trichocoleus sp. FACHB-90]